MLALVLLVVTQDEAIDYLVRVECGVTLLGRYRTRMVLVPLRLPLKRRLVVWIVCRVLILLVCVIDVETAQRTRRPLLIRLLHLDGLHITAYRILLRHKVLLLLVVSIVVQALILRRDLQRYYLLILHLSHVELCLVFG